MLILEIILMIVAWRRGWRGWALLPMGIVYIMAFLIGVISGAAGFSDMEMQRLLIVILPFEFFGIGVLIWMAAKGRKRLFLDIEEQDAEDSPALTEAA